MAQNKNSQKAPLCKGSCREATEGLSLPSTPCPGRTGTSFTIPPPITSAPPLHKGIFVVEGSIRRQWSINFFSLPCAKGGVGQAQRCRRRDCPCYHFKYSANRQYIQTILPSCLAACPPFAQRRLTMFVQAVHPSLLLPYEWGSLLQ